MPQQEIVGLLVACGDILELTINTIRRTTTALDRTKSGAQNLNAICSQIRVTKQILEGVIKADSGLHNDVVYSAVEIVKSKASNLQDASEELSKHISESKFKNFLDEFFRGDARIQKFDKMQNELTLAQTTLITSLVVFKDPAGHSDINMNTMEQVNKCFNDGPKSNYPRRLIELIGTRGVPLGDGSFCRVRTQDLEALVESLPSSAGQSVRVISRNEMKGFSLAVAGVGSKGEGIPHLDRVEATDNRLEGNAILIAGAVDNETARNMQELGAKLSGDAEMLQASLQVMKNDERGKQIALDHLAELFKRKNTPTG